MIRYLPVALAAIPLACIAQAVTVEVPPHTSMNVTIQSQPIDDTDPKEGKCGMVAGLVKAIANQKESGMSKKQQMQILGQSKFNQFWVDSVYAAPKNVTPGDMRDAVYTQCMEQN
jgi:hypothetical protein